MIHRFLSRLPLVALGAAWAFASPPAHGQAPAATPPNVLWLIAEDMGPELSIYGTPEVRTPHLDALAKRGMLFTHAFTTSPVCSSSRSAFNTGMYQMAIGAQNHRSHRPDEPGYTPFPLPPGVRLVSDWLRDAGYLSANVVEFPEGTGLRGTGKTDWNFTYPAGRKPFDTNRWSDLKSGRPFFAQVNFSQTHRGAEWTEATEEVPTPADPGRVQFPPYYPDHPVIRQDWAQYLDNVMLLDRRVGEVLALLERDGLADNTVIVFMGDNGRAMVRGKQWPYDSGLRVPLIVYWPEALAAPAGYRRGTVSDQLVSSLDVTATTLAFAGLEKPAAMQGRVLMGPRREPAREYLFGGRDRGDETVDRIRTVRSRRYRYLLNDYPERPFLQTNRYKESQYPAVWVLRSLGAQGKLTPPQAQLVAPTRPREELYDLETDPYEIHNLADSPAHQSIRARLRGELEAWIERIDDQGRVREDPRIAEYYDGLARERNGERVEQLRREWGLAP